MKRLTFLFTLLTVLSFTAAAQVKVGYFSYDAAIKAMPEYQATLDTLQTIRSQYESEARRAEEEFNTKYEEFLDSYDRLAASIRRKRQTEMQQLLESNVKFREETRKLIRQAEEEKMAELSMKLNERVRLVAQKHGFSLILNTDGNACPYIDPMLGEDIGTLLTEDIK
ncbi:MAG: OmpH family outer membrane protein [Bacteroidales bacterium]|nr:OmpH family outer membrane protein [Bacteroidales bacterium]MCM1146939.1 OmpH family outer membrane protein [Bacteroidales bacterium]MCM1207014.1 OmpH family outer membrane protein [Bacillota bacterium]MCM1511432.1 OmpH family outer membrane protein [Clostridium sp.]